MGPQANHAKVEFSLAGAPLRAAVVPMEDGVWYTGDDATHVGHAPAAADADGDAPMHDAFQDAQRDSAELADVLARLNVRRGKCFRANRLSAAVNALFEDELDDDLDDELDDESNEHCDICLMP